MNSKQSSQLAKAKEHAILKNGKCLSTEYFSSKKSLIWKCANPEHKEWMANFDCIKNLNSWCPHCSKEKRADQRRLKNVIDTAADYALSKGGQCLTKEYKTCKDLFLWKCNNENHKSWHSQVDSVLRKKSWCPECAAEIKKNKNGLTKAKEHAINLGGLCLSTEYTGSQDKMLWKCSNNNHQPWMAKFNSVVSGGNWCPLCSKAHLSEKRTRLIFERFFGKSFPTDKPRWNINPFVKTKKNKNYTLLELDGYCAELKIAFEHDGQHHFNVANYNGHKYLIKDLIYQQFKDEQKRKNCIRQGVYLINIPIVAEKHRNKFSIFLENVVNACKVRGFEMKFTDDELIDLEKDFFSIQ